MGMEIRKHMANADVKGLLGSHTRPVEMDEAYIGGRMKGGKRGRGSENKTVVFGIKERGGYIRAAVVPDASIASLRPVVLANVKPGSMVSTDEHRGYNLLVKDGFLHSTVNHSQGEYSRVDDLGATHVNSVESFWRLFKASVRGTHVAISREHTQTYISEFTCRQNYRELSNGLFDVLLAAL